jgi:recombination protein RecT
MVVQGLNLAKHQCAFIAYGNKLTFQRQYQGSILLAKRMSDVVDVKANAIYKNDTFVFEVNADTGVKKVLKHEQTLDSIDIENVVGAYAILKLADGTTEHEIMNMKQIRKSWEMGATKGASPAHKNFPDEMACKTVINRACKLKIEASDDSDLLKDDDNVDTLEATADQVKETVKNKANKRSLSIDTEDAEIISETKAEATSVEAEAVSETNGAEGQQVKAPF